MTTITVQSPAAENLTAEQPAKKKTFRELALEIPGVLSFHTKIEDIDFNPKQEYETIDVSRVTGFKPNYEGHMIVTAKHIIVGGMEIDNDASHCKPIGEDGTGDGDIAHYGRRGDAEENAAFRDELGLDQYGDPRYELAAPQIAAIVDRELASMLFLKLDFDDLLNRAPTGRVSDMVVEVLEQAVRECGNHDDFQRLIAGYDDDWLTEREIATLQEVFAMLEPASDPGFQEARSTGAIGTEFAQFLDIYEHTGISYSLAGHGMQCRWDTSSASAVWIPCKDAIDNIYTSAMHQLGIGMVKWFGAFGSDTEPLHAKYSLDKGVTWIGHFAKWRDALDAVIAESGSVAPDVVKKTLDEVAQSYCKSVIETYNSWVNGEVYSLTTTMIDRETGEHISHDDDNMHGFIGYDEALSELQGQMLGTARYQLSHQ